MQLQFLEEAREELALAAEYCEADVPARGGRLLLDFEDTMSVAQMFPHSGKRMEFKSGLDVRGYLLGRFPYTVVCAILSHSLVIVAVAHHSRAPGYYRDRLDDFPR